jgi:GxxExxY protein
MTQINTDGDTGEFPLKKETYEIIGICMTVHNVLGHGFLEIIYKDAIEIELQRRNIQYIREKEFKIFYDGILLPHKFYADFVIGNNIIFEVNALAAGVNDEHVAKMINYLKASDCKVGLLINFGKHKLEYRRIVF